MSSRRERCDDDNNESIGFKIFKAVAVGAALGIGAFIGYQVYKAITEEDIEKISVTNASYSDKSHECPICLDSYALDDKLKILPCQHKYHADCILQWVRKHQNCPLCRRDC